jgi:hypothetical protein
MAFPINSFTIPTYFRARLLVPLAPAFKAGSMVSVIAYDIDTKTYAIQGEDLWVHRGVTRDELDIPPTIWERLARD